MKFKLLLLFILFCSLLAPSLPRGSLINAQCWPTTADSAITVAPGWYPYAAVDEQEQSVMVVYLAGAQIRVKKYSKYGCPMWNGNPAIALDTIQKAWLGYEGNQWGQVISDDSGGVIICWKDFRHSDIDQGAPVNDEVYVQRIDVNGMARYGPNGIRASGPHTDGRRIIGDMKTDYHNGFYIAYSADSNTTKTVLKHYDRNGNLLWAKYFSYSGYIDLNATDIQGNCFVSTANRRFKFDYNGNALWPDTLIGMIPDNIEFRLGGAFTDGNGGVIGANGRYPDEIVVNRIDSNGQFMFGNGTIVDSVDSWGYIKYISDNKGGIFLSWSTIYGRVQRIDYLGNKVYISSGLIPCYPSCGGPSDMVLSDNNNIIALFFAGINPPYNSIFVQKMDSLGVRLWGETGLIFHQTSDEFFELPVLKIQSDKRGGAVYLWTELGSGIYVKIKQVSHNGILGEVDSTISIADEIIKSKSFILQQNYPNPFNNTTTISYHLNNGGKIKLMLYNVLGQEVKTLINEFKQEGYHQYSLNMNQLASGVYIYRLITSDGSKSKKLVFIK